MAEGDRVEDVNVELHGVDRQQASNLITSILLRGVINFIAFLHIHNIV